MILENRYTGRVLKIGVPYSGSVVEAAKTLQELCTGSLDGEYSNQDFRALTLWLEWRVEECWFAAKSKNPSWDNYDAVVRELARAAVEMAMVDPRFAEVVGDQPAPPASAHPLRGPGWRSA